MLFTHMYIMRIHCISGSLCTNQHIVSSLFVYLVSFSAINICLLWSSERGRVFLDYNAYSNDIVLQERHNVLPHHLIKLFWHFHCACSMFCLPVTFRHNQVDRHRFMENFKPAFAKTMYEEKWLLAHLLIQSFLTSYSTYHNKLYEICEYTTIIKGYPQNCQRVSTESPEGIRRLVEAAWLYAQTFPESAQCHLHYSTFARLA